MNKTKGIRTLLEQQDMTADTLASILKETKNTIYTYIWYFNNKVKNPIGKIATIKTHPVTYHYVDKDSDSKDIIDNAMAHTEKAVKSIKRSREWAFLNTQLTHKITAAQLMKILNEQNNMYVEAWLSEPRKIELEN